MRICDWISDGSSSDLPRIVILPPGSHVVDAIKAAGGIRKGADLTGLNQARALVDGEQVVVGVPPPPGQAASAAPAPGHPGPGELVNLHTATVSQPERSEARLVGTECVSPCQSR